MSVENLKEYAQRCATEPELRAKARELGMSDLLGHMQHADSLGLGWSEGDMVALRKEIVPDEEIGHLSEKDMEAVAGGAVTLTTVAMVVGFAVAAGLAAGAGAGAMAGSAGAGGAAAAGRGGW